MKKPARSCLTQKAMQALSNAVAKVVEEGIRSGAFKPAIEAPYRWRDWAAKADGIGDGVCARIKEELLKEFNLHTIVRLPNGMFAPYTSIPTNILFFDRSGPTREVWYYEQPLPTGRKNYTKTAPIQFAEFAGVISWWNKREENERAWKVSAAELLANGCNLDRKNPRAREDITHLPPVQLAADILKKEQRITEIMGNIRNLLAKHGK